MTNWRLWLHWSWRDLRSRWLQVVAIALIIALGTGVFAGLGGQKTWRLDSYDLSYSRLHMYDLKMELASGSFVNGEDLIAALADIDGIETLETRLITATLVNASQDDKTILVRGRIVGVDVTDGGPHVNSVYVGDDHGRTLTEADSGKNVAVVEYKFAKHYGLEPGDPIRISGDITLDFVGAGHSPEYFMIIPESGAFFGQSDLAVLFVPLATAQRIAGREGMVNDAVFLLDDGADRATVQDAIQERMAAVFPNTGVDFIEKEDDPVYNQFYTDVESDQWVWNIIAILFLFGAAMGAFNLAGRMVEAQRREIGIGMALGLPRVWIALRPMLVGVQIAVLGTIFGIVIGYGLGQLFGAALEDLVPLPYYDLSFYVPGYVWGTLLGILLPFVATLVPVWRAVRVMPVDAIKSGYLVAKGNKLNRKLHHIPLPGKSFMQMPIRNIIRSPWRTLLTMIGIAIAIMMITFIIGAMDSYLATMEKADDAYRYQAGERVLVDLDTFYPVKSDRITTLTGLTDDTGQPLFTETEPVLVLGGTLIAGDDEIDTAIELHDMDNAIWVPDLIAGQLESSGEMPGIIISDKAADDLGVEVGDTITLEHPRRQGESAFRLVRTEVEVTGIHDNPLRPLSYMHMSDAAVMGLADTTNQLVVQTDMEIDDLKAALLTQPGVTSVKSIEEFSESVQDLLELVTGILYVVEGVVVVMAFLIAFNSTSISVDERVREIATMFAFGLRIRTVTRMQMVENVVIGVLGTAIGIFLGWAALVAIFFARADIEMPDLQFQVVISFKTILMAAAMGVIVVGLVPLLSIRKMSHMDIPSTLRVME
jgi:putative ABC transport system permease protein